VEYIAVAMANTKPKLLTKTFMMRSDDEFARAIERIRALRASLARPEFVSKSDVVRDAVMRELARMERTVR